MAHIIDNKVYLTRGQQMLSGYESPIDLETFDLHGERETADAELMRFDGRDGTYSLGMGLGESHAEYQRALARSEITREISKELGRRILAETGTKDIETFLNDQVG